MTAIAVLPCGGVGEADGGERGQSRRDADLDEDGGGFDPVQRRGAHPREHGMSVGGP